MTATLGPTAPAAPTLERLALPAEYAQLAQDFMLGRFQKVEPEALGRVRFQFQNGSVVTQSGRFAGLMVRDSYNGYRPVMLDKRMVSLASVHCLGSFQGTDAGREGRSTYLFEYGAVETVRDDVVGVIARGARVTAPESGSARSAFSELRARS